MTAQVTSPQPKRIYLFGLFIEKTVYGVVVLGLGVLLSSYFLPIDIPNRDYLFILSGVIAIYTLLYHEFVYFRNPTPIVAFLDNLVYMTFIFILNLATGGVHSPLFFLFLLPIISVRLNLGSKLPMALTFYAAALVVLELLIQTNPEPTSFSNFIGSFQNADIYAAGTYIISLLLVGLYIRSMSIELTTEHEEMAEIERLNTELQRIDRGKDEFISIASHEIRTPLTALRGGLELLTTGRIGTLTKEQKDFLGRLTESANRLAGVAEESLNISALERYKMTLSVAPFDLTELISKVITQYSPEALEKKIQLTFEKPTSPLPKAMGDRERIETVLINLVSNALKFTPSGGTVTVRSLLSGSQLVTSVADTGIGIPQDELKNLFHKFYRVEGVMNEQTQGTGLGLYIVKLIMDLHGQTVAVESEEGKGSTFTFTLKADSSSSK